MTKVLVADTQSIVVSGIRYLLEKNPSFTIIGDVSSWETTLVAVQNNPPDLLILDYLTLSGCTYEGLQQFGRQYPSIRICIVTNDQDQKRILHYLQINPLVFLTKSCSQQEIITSLQAATSGQKFFCNKVLQILMDQSVQSEQDSLKNSLSYREIQIIRLISQELSTQTIADKLNLSPHTINAHRKRILKKLGVKSPVGLVVEAMRLQLI
jgi:DNA-binding NarL/FixJ family response regulator